MKHFKHVLGLLSRDMLFLEGHFMAFQGLDGVPRLSDRSRSRDASPVTDAMPIIRDKARCAH